LVFEKKYFDGDEVHIPGISGECNHFIVAIRPAESDAPETEITQIPPVKATGSYEKRQYQSYVSEVFNDADALSRLGTSGDVLLEKRENERDMYAKISGTGSISGKVDAKYKTVCSALVTPMTNSGS
ncbi:MAG: hypothetical protein KBS59_01075, partial [Clostridiales bacterium]|nr:hypothetical protein [Clostridiales bacterium]